MKEPGLKSIDIATDQLRAMIRNTEEGQLLGGEEQLLAKLGVSRATLRQAARLLEREGMLKVRRGINGGYVAMRPTVMSISRTVSTYLELIETEREDVTEIASLLWVDVVRKAAIHRDRNKHKLVEPLKERLLSLPDNAPFEAVRDLDAAIRKTFFALIKSTYTELIFNINAEYANQHFRSASVTEDTPAYKLFVRNWVRTKLLELDAFAGNDPHLGMMAAKSSRSLWHERLWGHPPK